MFGLFVATSGFVAAQKRLRTKPVHAWEHSDYYGREIAYSPDGRTLALTTVKGIALHYASNGALIRTLPLPYLGGRKIAFSPDGRLLASGGVDGILGVWSVSDGRRIYSVQAHDYQASEYNHGVINIAISPNGQLLASTGWDRVVRVWRVADGSLLYAIEKPAYRITFSADGRFLSVGTAPVEVYRASDGRLVWQFDESGDAKFCPDGRLLIATNHSAPILLVSASGARPINRFFRGGGLDGSVVSPNGRLLAVRHNVAHGGALFNQKWHVDLWWLRGGLIIQSLSAQADYVHDIVFSPDGSMLAARTNRGVCFWRVPFLARLLP
jgi:WD40 repeat protein